jgi:hypothetical protein
LTVVWRTSYVLYSSVPNESNILEKMRQSSATSSKVAILYNTQTGAVLSLKRYQRSTDSLVPYIDTNEIMENKTALMRDWISTKYRIVNNVNLDEGDKTIACDCLFEKIIQRNDLTEDSVDQDGEKLLEKLRVRIRDSPHKAQLQAALRTVNLPDSETRPAGRP